MRKVVLLTLVFIISACSSSKEEKGERQTLNQRASLERGQESGGSFGPTSCGYQFEALGPQDARSYLSSIEGLWYSGASGAIVGRRSDDGKQLYREALTVGTQHLQSGKMIMTENFVSAEKDPYQPVNFEASTEQGDMEMKVGAEDQDGFRIVEAHGQTASGGTAHSKVSCTTYAFKLSTLSDGQRVLLFKGPRTVISTQAVPVSEFYSAVGSGSRTFIGFPGR